MPNERRNCFVDTTLLVYAIDPSNPQKQRIAADLLRAVARADTLVLSAQSLNEFYRVATDRRGLLSREEARAEVARLESFCTAPYDFDVTQYAWRIQDQHAFSWWDCVSLASACRAQCRVFFSEDLQHGRRIDGLTIIDPFRTGRGDALME
jgi:predicted nucleic acid-binding protein